MSSGQGRAAVKPNLETWQMGTPAGVSVGEADAPAESTATGRDGCAAGDYVVHEIHGKELNGAAGANDGVLFHREAGETMHTATGGRFHGVGAADGTFDAGTENQLGDGAGECKIGDEAPVTCGNWHQPTRTVNECCHVRGSDLDGGRSRDFQVPRGAACDDLLGARGAATDGDILCGMHCQLRVEGWRA
jgi:hypothetical protein